MTEPPPRPGPIPHYTAGTVEEWHRYIKISDAYWEDVAERLSKLVPVEKVDCWKPLGDVIASISSQGAPFKVHNGRLYVPSKKNLLYIGGGEVIQVVYEDKSYAWLGGVLKADDFDGPYAFGPADYVGGYRYRGDPGDCGDIFTEKRMVDVDDPEDPDSVAQALAKAARQLGTLDFTETC